SLPFAASVYVVSSAVWLLPDNAGWWGVLALMLISWRPRVDWRTWLLGGLVLLALVFVRQVHAWAAGLLIITAWLGPAGDAPSQRAGQTLAARRARGWACGAGRGAAAHILR